MEELKVGDYVIGTNLVGGHLKKDGTFYTNVTYHKGKILKIENFDVPVFVGFNIMSGSMININFYYVKFKNKNMKNKMKTGYYKKYRLELDIVKMRNIKIDDLLN